MNLEKTRVEEILCILDKEGCIFPGFELVKLNDRLRILGQGGFSTVYEMKCLERPENQYVLKIMGFERQAVTSENFWNTVRLQHYLCEHTQHVCRIILEREIRVVLDDKGELQEITEVRGERWEEDGLHLQFILMEKLEGVISKNRFGKISLLKTELENETEVIDFALQVGSALHHAHSNGILHRDVKLENIFWDNTLKCYKLGDFGIAKFVESGNAETVVYTDGYGAPEIEKRLNDCYNATADIYSLGITLYLLLNDFRFPGSEGYYVNMVQYNPEFVFPAPIHASADMTRIIRNMCQFYQEDRYQSMAEVLMDLSVLKNKCGDQIESKETELLDFETETYREDKNLRDFHLTRMEHNYREKRKEDEKLYDEIHKIFSVCNFIGFTLIFTLLLTGLQTETSLIYNGQLWGLVIAVLIEAILLSVKEFHILFGVATVSLGIYFCISNGISLVYVLLICGVLISIPAITGACATSIMLWRVLVFSEKIKWLDFIEKYDLSWILLVISIFMLVRYEMFRIELNKTSYIRAKMHIFIFDKIPLAMIGIGAFLLLLKGLGLIEIPEIIQRLHLVRSGVVLLVTLVIYMNWCGYINDEVQECENDMDERRNGESSDTIG